MAEGHMRSNTKPNPAAVRDWRFLMIALAISLAGIGAYAAFNSIVSPAAQHEVLTDRRPIPIPAEPRRDPAGPPVVQ